METAMRKLLTFLIALGAIVFAVVSPGIANGVLFLAQSASSSNPIAANPISRRDILVTPDHDFYGS